MALNDIILNRRQAIIAGANAVVLAGLAGCSDSSDSGTSTSTSSSTSASSSEGSIDKDAFDAIIKAGEAADAMQKRSSESRKIALSGVFGSLAAVLMLALGAAVYLNWSFSREAPPSLVVSDTAGEAVETSAQAAEPVTDPLVLETAAGADTQMMSAEETANKNYGEAQLVSVNKDSGTEFFESARLTRSKARDEALDTLKKSLKDTKLTSEEKEQLTTQLSDRISNITLETKLETLIKSKGFTDCVVNLEGSKANVTVMTESDALNAEEVTRIRDALLSQCKGLTAQDITIVEVK